MAATPQPHHNLILCIEPEGEICLLLSKMLQSKEFDVKHVISWEETSAVHFFEAEQPALIVIDNTFAENDIGPYIAAIKERAPESKILMVSSVDGSVATIALSMGVDDFLTKPFTKSRLLDKVSTMLS